MLNALPDAVVSPVIPYGILPVAKSKAGIALLPGHGEPREGCGTERAMHCPNCDTSFWGTQSCMTRECPNCYEKWAAKEGREASKRMGWGSKVHRRRLYEAGERRTPRIVHCQVSVVAPIEDIDDVRKLAYRVAMRHGVLGGCAVTHHERMSKVGMGDGTVHVHMIGPAFDIAPMDIGEGGSDFDWNDNTIIFKHIKDKEYKDHRGFRSQRAVKRAIQYLLTHCAIIEGKHALTWWGCMSYTKRLSKRVIESEFPGCLDENDEESTPCPVCGNRMTEPCVRREAIFSWGDWEHERPSGCCEVAVHPEPEYPFGEQCPGEALWDAIRSVITVDAYGKPRYGLNIDDILRYIREDPEKIERVIWANIQSGRLKKDDSGIISVRSEFTLDKALNEMWWMTSHGVAPRSGDSELRKMLSGCCSDTVMDDITFVFGPVLERFERGCAGVAKSW